MFWLIATVVLGIVFWGGVALFVAGSQLPDRRAGLGAAVTACVLWLLISGFTSIHLVGQRQIAIVYNFSGTITGTKNAGTVTTWPWQHIQKENIGIQSEEFDLDPSNSAVSSDQQQVYARLFLNFQVEPSHVLTLYKTIGPGWKKILLDARVLQDFKETTAQYAAADITRERPALRSVTRQRLTEELNRYDIHVVDFFVKNVGFSDAFDRAITARNVQAQRALQAQAKVAQSKAEADQVVAKARGDAEAIRLKGQALRNNPDVLRLTAIQALADNPHTVYLPVTSNLFLGGLAGSAK